KYDIHAVRVPSGSFNFVLLITFCRPLNRVRSPYSWKTFLSVNYSQVTRD
ncbi:hypothetical protein K443DRAFT_686544, partial [Laccaria amethystina LaAM-08-1]